MRPIHSIHYSIAFFFKFLERNFKKLLLLYYPAFYYKKSVKLNVRSLYSDREQILDAFLYIMHEERHLGLPSAQYVSVCRQGYTDFGFNEKFLRRALADSMGDKK